MSNEFVNIPTLEQLPEIILQQQLDSTRCTNRLDPSLCQIRAKNDHDAIKSWLNEYKGKLTTFRSYQKEAERLLLWCVFQHKKPLSSLDKDDLEVYFDFLSNPRPKSFWCASKGGYARNRGSKYWRPFEKGLSSQAKVTAISILNSLFSYLTVARYLNFNPFTLMKNKGRFNKDQELRKIKVVERILDLDEWHAMLDTLEEIPETSKNKKEDKLRLKLLVYVLYFLGIRISELEKSTWSSFRESNNKWWFFVIGKGDKLGKIPVNKSLLRTIKEYRLSQQLSELPNAESEENHIPILYNWNTGKALTSRYMNKLLKELALKTAEKFKEQPKKVEKLKKFSAHWLRHLSASMQDKAGISFKHIKANHRHVSDDTTRIYIHAFDEERHADMEKLTLKMEFTKGRIE